VPPPAGSGLLSDNRDLEEAHRRKGKEDKVEEGKEDDDEEEKFRGKRLDSPHSLDLGRNKSQVRKKVKASASTRWFWLTLGQGSVGTRMTSEDERRRMKTSEDERRRVKANEGE